MPKRIFSILCVCLLLFCCVGCGRLAGIPGRASQEPASSPASTPLSKPTATPGEAPDEIPAAGEGDWFAGMQSVDMDGNQMTAEYFAKYDITMINVWASWCGYCIQEMPGIEEIHRQNQNIGVLGLILDFSSPDGIVTPQEKADCQDVIDELNITYPNITDFAWLLETDFANISGIPVTYFVDSYGRMLGEPQIGARTKEEWLILIRTLAPQ